MNQDTLNIIGTAATVLEALVVAITLIYVIRQTSATSESVQQIKHDMLLDTIISARSQTREINNILIGDEELASLLGYTKKDVLAFMILHDLEMKYLMQKRGFTDSERWDSEKAMVPKIAKLNIVQNVWEEIKPEYHPEFVSYFEPFVSQGKDQETA